MSTGAGTVGDGPEAAEPKRMAAAKAVVGEGLLREEPERVARRLPASSVSRVERERLVSEARAITFPAGLRGYERAAVDRYVQEVNRLIAELEVSASPEAAVRHALAEVSEETREILQRAHETADEVVLRSRAKADETVQQAEAEAQEIRNAAQREAIDALEAAREEARQLLENAVSEAAELRVTATREATELRETSAREAGDARSAAEAEADSLLRSAHERADEVFGAAEKRARELAEGADLVWRERRRLVEDVRDVGEQLIALADTESSRFARPITMREATRDDRDLDTALHDTIAGRVAAVETGLGEGGESNSRP